MRQAWPLYRALFVQTLRVEAARERRALQTPWLLVLMSLLLAGALLVCVALALRTGEWKGALRFIAGILICFSFMLMGVICRGAARLSEPASASLLPALRGRLARLVIGAWIITSLVAGTVAGLAVGHMLGAIVIVSAISMIASATGMAAMFYTPLLPLAPLFYAQAWHAIAPPWRAFLTSAPGLALFELLIVLNGAIFLRAMLRPNKRAPLARAVLRDRFGMLENGVLPYAGHIVPLARRGIYPALLRRACRGKGGAAALMPHVLGPRAHWSAQSLLCALLLLLAVFLYGALGGQGGESAFAGVPMPLWMLAVSAVGMAAFQAQAIVEAMQATRGEQALARLAPRVAPRQTLNAAVAAALLRQFLSACAMSIGTLLACAMLLGATTADLLDVLSISLGALLLAPALVRNQAVRRWRVDSGWQMVGLMALIGLFSVGHRVLGWPWPFFGLACAWAALHFVRRRWRHLASWPVAWPSGRISN
ncbi:MAG: hypothetical protein V4582_22875 [Pseudomonadota bacterium]